MLAPLVGEFLLGNLRIDHLFVLPLFALLYGAGALLIRETVRRTGRGWPAIVLLAAAYALLEEGLVDQLLWNPSYSGQVTLAGDAYLPALGTNVSILQAVLSSTPSGASACRSPWSGRSYRNGARRRGWAASDR